MKRLQSNPLGMVLVGFSGLLVLLALVMAVFWTTPVAVQIDETETKNIAATDLVAAAGKVGPLTQYEVINQKPVFNESRLPVIEEVEEDLPEEEADIGIAVADAPDVKLTGIIIAPGMKIASLTPNDGNIENVMAYEGDSLIGEFVGWQVSKISPRNVVLESRNGQKLELELEVHDSQIQQPAKPATPTKEVAAKTADAGQPKAEVAGDEEPLSRAEQIRQRIAERREELKLQQEKQTQQRTNRVRNAPKTNAYQAAIQAKIGNERKDKNPGENDDG